MTKLQSGQCFYFSFLVKMGICHFHNGGDMNMTGVVEPRKVYLCCMLPLPPGLVSSAVRDILRRQATGNFQSPICIGFSPWGILS